MSGTQHIVTRFTTKLSQPALIRWAELADVPALMNFINVFSLEDRFTRFSGEQMTLEQEQAYLESEMKAIETGDAVKLFCFIDGELAGVCDIHRDASLLTRKLHTGVLGLIVGKEFRGQGIGEALMKTTLNEAAKKISGLRMIKLDCFATNAVALSLYKKLGFREVGRIPESILHKGEYVDEVLMVKDL